MSLKELKKAIAGKAIYGSKETLKLIKRGKVQKVFLSSNCQEDFKRRIQKYAVLGEIEVFEMKENNHELGTLCKKPYAISVISI